MAEKRKEKEESAWQVFARTGQVSDYLAYYAAAHSAAQEEPFNANQNPGTDPQGTEYR